MVHMKRIIPERMAARLDGDFVVFILGMRINALWKVHRWWPVAKATRGLMRELQAAGPDIGFLGHTGLRLIIVQYWRSFDHLEAWARAEGGAHRREWAAFNRAIGNARGDVGMWHETYLVKAGNYEAVYSGMPPFGLGRASELVPATGGWNEARGRLGPAGRQDSRSDGGKVSP
jgi:hypothetical protein